MVTLQYPNSDIGDVLHLYETLTGKRLVMDNFVQGKVNIFITKPVPREEAIKIIEMNLLMNGFSLIPAEGDIVKVIGTSQNPRTTGVPIISDPAQIPSGDHVISFLFKLRYADPTELQQVLGQYLSPPKTYTSFLALPKAGAILVTENSSVMRTLATIIDQIDVAPAEVVSEFIKVERADAQKIADELKDLAGQAQSQPGQGTRPGTNVRPIRPPTPGVPNAPVQAQVNGEAFDLNGTPMSEESFFVGKPSFTADVRTNRIHVVSRPVNMPLIRKLIAQFDANVDFAKPVTRPLRYISAADVLPVIVQTLTEPGTGQGGTSEPTNNPNVNAQQQSQQRRTTATSNSASTAGDFGQTGSSGSGLNVSEELSTQAVDTTPKAVTVGNAKIIADQRSNAIIILGNREVVVKVQKILDEMDVSSPQVALSTVIGELTLNNDEEFGVDYFGRHRNIAIADRNGGFAVPSPASSGSGGLLDPANLLNFQQVATAAATGGANVYLHVANNFAAVVRFLQTTGNFKTISRPTVFTSNNKKAIIASGTEIPVPVSTIQNAVGNTTGLAQQSNIQFKKVALQLEVVPLINSEKEVSLDILQKLDSVAGFTQVDNNQIPNIATRYIRTSISAPNCSTIVLGGLITDDKQRNTTGIPVLSRIPVVGALFRNTGKIKKRTELIILMRPEVTLTKLDLARLRQKDEDKLHFGPELDQDDCPDCPKTGVDKQIDDKQVVLPGPDLPATKIGDE